VLLFADHSFPVVSTRGKPMQSRTSFKGETSRVSAFAISVGIVLTLFAPQFAPAQEIGDGTAVSQSSLSVTQEALKSALARGSGEKDGAKSTRSAVEAFYSARDYWPVWTGTKEADRAAEAARSVLSHADRQGLDPSVYISSPSLRDERAEPGKEAALVDIALTDAVLRYAHDVHSGRVRPKDVYRDVGLPPKDFDASAGLASAIKSDAVDSYLNGLPPSQQGYRNLVVALGRYRDAAKQGKSPDNAHIQQIIANMERWRWLPDHFERRYISVNVPDQNLEFISDGKVLMTSKVIVGKKTTPSPILRTVSDSIIANPPWNVPSDIAARQLLPNLKRNSNYLAGHNMVVVDGPSGDPRGTTIDWRSIPEGQFPYQVRQLPGPASAMGIVMLDSPNDFDVYLHDTPGKKPFEENERGVSNGCIRVQQMIPLASLALTNDSSAGLGQVNGAIASHETRKIPLTDPIPIYMLYWTAVADADGNVGFREDRYDRDAPLIRMLNSAVVASK
jgi:murein L,D-transpeptidase YcbB/YkuD